MTVSAFLARSFSCLCAMLLLAGCGEHAQEGPVVLAPSSMQEAITAAAAAWEAQGHSAPVLGFAGTPSLARQIELGAPADIVIAADQDWMDWLDERGLIAADSRRVIAGNALALVSASRAGSAGSIEDRLRAIGTGRLALADPQSVPAGRYARAALEEMGLWDALAERVVPAENVRAALALVEAGEASLGIVYATDARASQRVHGTAIFDFRDMPEIVYPAARIAASDHPDAGQFLEFLSGPEAQDIFAAHGFVPYEQAL